MPPRPRWTARIPLIRQTIEALDAPLLDRSVIERTFLVGPRQANRLLLSFGGQLLGRSAVVERQALLDGLEGLAADRGARREVQRKQRVLEALDALRLEAAPRRRPVAPRPAAPASSEPALPVGIRLSAPGELAIAFASPEDLLGAVLALTEFAARDYAAFAAALEG